MKIKNNLFFFIIIFNVNVFFNLLSLVYWSLYKIVFESSWNNYYKTEGFSFIIVKKVWL